MAYPTSRIFVDMERVVRAGEGTIGIGEAVIVPLAIIVVDGEESLPPLVPSLLSPAAPCDDTIYRRFPSLAIAPI